jgi:hypothetical protein
MKTHLEPATEAQSRSVAQRAHSHHANAGAGISNGAPFEEDLGAPFTQRKARSLASAHSERVAQLQAVVDENASRPRGRHVQPTVQRASVAINDSPALEHEADVMGAKALQAKSASSLERG